MIIDYIKKNNIGKYEENISLVMHTSYKVGGTASYLVYPSDIKKLILLLKFVRENNIKYKILGNGSNTLFSDEKFDGIIIKLDNFDKVKYYLNTVKAGAGVNLMRLSMQTIKRGLIGLEFATGIPGTIGGAVYMNAGAYNSDMGYIVKNVKVLTPKYQVITMTNQELDFHYRTSFFQKNKDYICLEATLKFKKGSREALEEVVRDRTSRRILSQPLEYPSAGSVFRNPPDNLPAGKLIEDLGLKGYRIGGAMVSLKHANFIINYDNASASDIKGLIDLVHDKILKKYKIDLKIEQEFVNWEK